MENKKKNWFLRHKIITGIIFFIVFITIISASAENNSSKKSLETGSNTEEVKDTSNMTEEEKIQYLVEQQLKGDNNLDRPYLRNVSLTKQVDGGWGVFIDFNASDNLSKNLRKTGIESDMSELYIALYTSDYNVTSVVISAYFPLVDKYGKETEGIVYKTYLDKAEADKVNWEADSSTLKLQILPSVWTTSILHTEFQ